MTALLGVTLGEAVLSVGCLDDQILPPGVGFFEYHKAAGFFV